MLPDEIAQDITAEALAAQNWHDKGNRLYHGALLRITGTVRKNLPDNQFLMSCGLQDVTINVSVCPEIADGIAIGSEISVTCLGAANRSEAISIALRKHLISV